MFYSSQSYSSAVPDSGFIYHNNLNPVYTINRESAQMAFNRANENIRQHREQYVEEFKKNYQTKIVILYSFLIILIGLVQIALQIIIIVEQSALLIIANSLFGGILCTILGLLALSLIKWKNYILIFLTFIIHIFSIFILITALIIINVFILIYLNSRLNGKSLALYLIMLALGLIAVALIIFYLVKMHRKNIFIYRFGTNIFFNNLQAPLYYQQHQMTSNVY